MREIRSVPVVGAEVRKDDDTEALRFTGHAAVFNQRTWIGPKKWGFWEEVDEGFFDDVLEDPAAFLVNHDPNIVLARNGSTMALTTDKKGLVSDAQWDPSDADAVKWAGRVRRGDANEMSFAFTVKEEKWSEDENGDEVRTLLKAERLYDVSLVTYPAYGGTDGSMRDQAAEIVLRHRGFDPREGRAHEVTDPEPAPPVNEVEQTEPAPVDTVPAVETETPGPATEPSEVRRRRHAANAKRFRLPL